MDFGAQDEVVRFLASLDGGAERIVTTHISIVALSKTHAYKLKKAVRFPYLDFSTPARRLDMCEREATLNKRFAPQLYLGSRRVTRESNRRLALDGAGEMVDAVVVMRRFADDDLFDQIAKDDRLTREMVESLARQIAKSHDDAAPDRTRGGAAAMRRILDETALSLHKAAAASAKRIDALVARLSQALDTKSALLDSRKAQGKVRRCHGDLTLRNICLFEGAPTLFDCLEFDDEIATIDVLYDVGFLLMDLWRVGAYDFSNVAFNRYLDARDETDGLPLLPFFMSLRAAIRAHVEASQQNAERARLYFNLAETLLTPAKGAIIAIGGLSGSGKSSIAAVLAPHIGCPPGARVINSDRIRKRLFGVAPTERLPHEAYASTVSAKVYAEMFDVAARTAALGWPVIVDAVFDRPEDREAIQAAAEHARAPFLGVWLDLDLAQRVARVDARVNDVSDATRDVLHAQMEKATGEIEWLKIDASKDAAKVATEIAATFESLSQGAVNYVIPDAR
ncbi:bifunctional aminoglycoside phosphotransferase/ATP-binding protein [Methylocystis sp. B8]|uniref:bifunctional aminoglycoside phosphotransferase/ATP-binding protein n=1 Tax=Methylocystis sp. B8 TaxID=544938 RepID=UPI0010FD8C87|nr:bifunctional aminoglycoside phosphotransferase/ATP-binding protein [Methylocystis sp. B8]TLG78845.1 aminoglycoside phosphotransferase [Methylocystis sp. B8]